MFLKRKESPAEAEEELFEEEEKEEASVRPASNESGAGFIVIPVILEFVLGVFVWFTAPAAVMTYLYCLVPMLLADGYEFCTVSELLDLGPVLTSKWLYKYDKNTHSLVLRPDEEQPCLQMTEEELNGQIGGTQS